MAVHFNDYMVSICDNLESNKGSETAVEALLYAFGNLKEKC